MSSGTGLSGQQARGRVLFDASGVLANGNPVLVLSRSMSRCYLFLQNVGTSALVFEFGPARATATLTNGAVSSIAVTNAGFGFSYPPSVELLGGGGADLPYGNSNFLGVGQDGAPSPVKPATATCVMTGSAPNMSIASITVQSGGANYKTPPYALIRNSANDPNGCAIPTTTPASATSTGILLAAGEKLIWTGDYCPIDQLAVVGVTGGIFTCKYST